MIQIWWIITDEVFRHASSFRCDKFKDYICKNGTLNTTKAEIINDELIMCIFKVVTSDKQQINQGAT